MLARTKFAAMLLLIWLGLSVLPASAQALKPGDLDAAQEKVTKDAVQKVSPCVVQIETSGGTDIISSGTRGPQVRKGIGPTTGVIVSADGYVISSAFNFANKPTDIFVTVPGKKRYVAKVVATDQARMLTLLQLLKIDPTDLPLPIPQATPKADIKVGQTAIALGRTLEASMERPPSISIGIISAIGRIWGKAVQTDAKVSPANYGGPLVDLQGRVQGVLVPASPRAEGETAGVEWYDSGIGFAIPLEDIYAVLPRLKQGKDLQRGVLGIRLPGQDLFAEPVIQSVDPDSTAAKAGIKAGDRITEIDGHPVTRQAHIQHLLGPKYEGDIVAVKVKRKEDGKDKEIALANLKLSAPTAGSALPFIGILPMRDDPELGLEVRYVYPKSPAEAAGLKPGDRIMKVGAGNVPLQPFAGPEHLATLLALLPAGSDLKAEVKRKAGGKTETLTVKLGEPQNVVPDKLPEEASVKKALTPRKTVAPMGPMRPMPPMPPKKEEEKKPPRKDDKKPETGLVKRTNAAADHTYWVYVPEDYDPNISYALLLWLHPVAKGKDEDMKLFKEAWEDYCSQNHIIVLAPKAESENGWTGSDTDFVQEVANEVLGQYTIDRRRVVAHGMGIGGQLAFRLGFRARDLIRGVATTGAVLAENPKENIPNQPLAFFVVAGEKDPIAKAIAEGKDKLTERKFPVIFHEIPDMGHQYLDEKTLDELVRWIDSLDRL